MYARLLLVLIVSVTVTAPVSAQPAAVSATSTDTVPAEGIQHPSSAVIQVENETNTTVTEPGEQIDGDGDGTLDGVAIDTNSDGIIDGIDADGDGRPDAIVRGDTDTDGDDQPDFFYNPGPAPVGSIEPGSGFVGPGAVVFQGEEDTQMVNFAENTIIGVPDRGAGGVPLDLNQTIPTEQPFGVYADSQENVLVVNLPRVSNLQVLGESGDEVSGGEIKEDEFVLVQASVNFLAASHAEVFPRDSTGAEIREGTANLTEVLERSPELERRLSTFRSLVPDDRKDTTGVVNPGIQSGLDPQDQVYLLLKLDELEKEDIYTIVARSEDDKPLGDFTGVESAQQSVPIRIVTAGDSRLEFDEGQRYTQDAFADFRVTESSVGRAHVIAVPASALRRDLTGTVGVETIASTFRRRDDLTARGVLVRNGSETDLRPVGNGTVRGDNVEWVFGVVRIDDRGFGRGQIDTGKLDDTRVPVTLQAQRFTTVEAIDSFAASPADKIDDASLIVERARFTLDTPGETYVAGDEVDLEGTSSLSVDDVAIYARDEGDWQFVLTSSVDSDGVFDETEVPLSELNDILAIPGTYQLGMIALEDADLDGSGAIDTPEERMLAPVDFRGSTSQRSIRVVVPTLRADFETHGGTIARGDGIDWNGTSVGPDRVFVIFVDDRGNVVVERQVVDSDSVFTGEDFRLDDPLDEGDVTVLALSPGRDGALGNGLSLSEFRARIERLDSDERRADGRQTLTREQILEQIADISFEDDASDDLVVRDSFRFTEPTLQIKAVAPTHRSSESRILPVGAGDTMLVRGRSNRDPEDTTIRIDLETGSNGSEIPVMVVDSWENGTFSTSTVVPRAVAPGRYTLRADDGDTTDAAVVEITASTRANRTASTAPRARFNYTFPTGDAGGFRVSGPSREGSVGGARPILLTTGETLTADVVVSNTGGAAGTYEATLQVNGEPRTSQTGRLEAGTSKTLTFSHVFTEPGEYTLSVRDARVAVSVRQPVGATPTPAETRTVAATPTPMETKSADGPGFGVVSVLAALGVLVTYLSRRH